jgi:PAS domain S-box-containing protein
MNFDQLNFAKMKILLGVMYIVLSISIYFSLNYMANKNKTEHLEQITKTYERSYNTVHKQYEELAYIIFTGISRISDANNKFYKLKTATKEERELIQDEIYDSVGKRFKELSRKHLRNINFIDRNKKLLVKLKNTRQNDMSISSLRKTIYHVFETKKAINSYEVGKNGAGFRFVYPILDDYEEEVLGAISITFGAEAITAGIMDQYYVLSNFFVSDKKIGGSQIKRNNFIPSHHEGFLFDKKVLKELKRVSRKDMKKLKPSKKTTDMVRKNGLSGTPKSYFDDEIHMIFTTIPIFNKISKELEGILVVRSKGEIVDILNDYFNIIYTLSLFVLFGVLIFFYQEYTKRSMMRSTIKIQEDLLKLYQQKEKELKEEKDRFQLAIDGTSEGIWDWKVGSDYVYFSPTYKKMIGYEDNELENHFETWKSRIHPDDLARVLEDVQLHIDKKTQVYESEFRFQHKNGSWVWVLARGKALFDESGNATRMIGFHTDLTKRKELERKMLNAEKMSSLGEMIGNIAHQWRQPLSVISSIASSIILHKQMGILSEDGLIKNATTIMEQTQSLSQTIDDFRDYIKGEMKLEKFLLSNTIQQIINIEKAILKDNEINVILDVDDNISLNSYPNAIVQSLINIINNAKDALADMEADRFIFIATKEMDDSVQIIIKDNAGGIPEEISHNIYEAYFTTKHKFQGTGLGLHMTYNLITSQLQGSIENKNVEYEYEASQYKGAEFIITLPKTIEEKKEK